MEAGGSKTTDNEGRVSRVKCKVQLFLGQLKVEAGGSTD